MKITYEIHHSGGAASAISIAILLKERSDVADLRVQSNHAKYSQNIP